MNDRCKSGTWPLQERPPTKKLVIKNTTLFFGLKVQKVDFFNTLFCPQFSDIVNIPARNESKSEISGKKLFIYIFPDL